MTSSEPEAGLVPLRFSTLAAMVVGGFYLLAVALAALLDLELLLGELGLHVSPPVRSVVGWTGALACFVVPALAVWLRQPKGARVTWDAWGVTEWDGEGVRTAIPWQRARLHVEHGSRRMLLTKGRSWSMLLVQITDGGGRRIMVGTNLWAGRLCRRRAEAARRAPLEALVEAARARGLPAAEPASWNDLSPGRPGKRGFVAWGAALVGYPLFVLGSALVTAPTVRPDDAVLLLFAGGLVLLLRLLRPARELVEVARRARAHSGARPVVLVGNAGTVLRARARTGEMLDIETDGLDHPDGRIASRRGPAFVVLESAARGGPSTPYRGGGEVVRTAAIETAAVVAARRQLLRAIVVELVLRGSLPVLAVLTAVAATGPLR